MAPTQEQWDEFWRMGDVNGDGYINELDMELIQNAYGYFEGEPGYNPDCDLNQDGVVDMKDLGACSFNYGKNIWDYFDIPPDILPEETPLIIIGGIIVTVGGIILALLLL